MPHSVTPSKILKVPESCIFLRLLWISLCKEASCSIITWVFPTFPRDKAKNPHTHIPKVLASPGVKQKLLPAQGNQRILSPLGYLISTSTQIRGRIRTATTSVPLSLKIYQQSTVPLTLCCFANPYNTHQGSMTVRDKGKDTFN